MINLRFRNLSTKQITELSKRYSYSYKKFSIKLKSKKFMIKAEFLKIGVWKSGRTINHYLQNDDAFVKEITKIAFSSGTSERMRIEILQLLKGVGYPVASALLHFGLSSQKYPIIDFRALWSLYEINKSQIKHDFYNFDLWNKYRTDCLGLAKKHNLSLRDLDKALWQFSKENQP